MKNTNDTTYTIAEVTHNYDGDRIRFRLREGTNDVEEMTLEEAHKIVEGIDSSVYRLGHNEASQSGRNFDPGNYDWDECSCTLRDGDCCGECEFCCEHVLQQDIEYLEVCADAIVAAEREVAAKIIAAQNDDPADPLICDGYNKETDEVFFHDSQADYYVTADGDFCYASAR